MADIEIRDQIARIASGTCASRDFGYEEALEVADALLTSPILRSIQAEAVKGFADELTRKGVYSFNIHDIRKYAEAQDD